MGSNTKKSKVKESRKRRHRSRSESPEKQTVPKEKRHRHHRKHHKDRRHDKPDRRDYDTDDSDVVEVVPDEVRTITPPPPPTIAEASYKSVESLSIEETNKLRAKLGLRPLNVEDSSSKKPDGKRKDDLGEFYHKPAPNLSYRNEQEKIRSKLSDHKAKRSIEAKLAKVKTLGEADGEEDIQLWVQKSRSSELAKREAAKRAKILEELDEQFGVSELLEREKSQKSRRYTERNLKGLRVEHDTDNFTEGQLVILTLKDQQVLDDGEDVLVNVNMLDDERYKKSVLNKKQKPGYNPYDMEEFDEFGDPKPSVLLSKYDEEIDGTKRDSFQIGIDANVAEKKRAALLEIKAKLANKRLESLEMPERKIASDYYTEEEMCKFRKPKKMRKMRKKNRMLTADDLEMTAAGSRHRSHDYLNTDDLPVMGDVKHGIKLEEEGNELERALAKARKIKLSTGFRENSNGPSSIKIEPETDDGPDLGSIVLNSTAEFCRTLGDIPTYGKSGNREDTENMMDFAKDDVEMEQEQEDVQIEEGGRWNAVDPNHVPVAITNIPVEIPILDEEPDVGSGVGAALKLAMSKGYLDKEEKNRPSNSRLAHLQAQHYSIEDKSYGEDFDRGNRRDRYTGPTMEFKERDTFKPNVKLEYIDDDGRVLNSKEAFRYLSHKFHGKGPGKNKVEKRLKKTQQEGLMKKMSSTDTPLGTLNMLQSKQKEMQTPFIVLSGGKHTHSTSIAKARR